jgi:nitrogen fixation NifU-like protein
MAYSEKVVDHYNNPRNVGSLPKEDPNVGTGLVGAPECGDVMKLQMKINPDTNVIEEAKFKTFGCGSAIASSSLATEWVKGKTVEEALNIKNTDIVRELALPPVKIHCSVLAEDAIKAAIGDWKKKHGIEVPATERLELGLFDHVGVGIDFHLQLHDVAALRRAYQAGPDIGIFLGQAADVAGIVVMLDYLFAISH